MAYVDISEISVLNKNNFIKKLIITLAAQINPLHLKFFITTVEYWTLFPELLYCILSPTSFEIHKGLVSDKAINYCIKKNISFLIYK